MVGLAVACGGKSGLPSRTWEVLVSRTVRDLVAGSGIDFVSRGVHELKGVSSPGRSLPSPEPG